MLRLAAIALTILAIALHGTAVIPRHVSAEETVEGMAGQLMCQCGCGLVVAACGGVMDCSIGDKMKATIGAKLAEGKTRAEILDYFASVYGEVVLAAPAKSGFNLSAWIIPFVAVGAGVVVLALVLRGWLGRSRPEAEAETPMEDEELALYRTRVEQELQRGAQ